MIMTELSIVPAGAGAGKTHHIQDTLTKWVRAQKVRPEKILAVTFTEAAAGELRQRIRSALISDGNLGAALAVERAYVSTIHGLGRRLLTEHALAAGSSPQQRLIAEDEQDLLIRRSIAENEALNELARNLESYGYRSSFTSNETAEDSFRADILGVMALLRTLGPRGLDSEIIDLVETSIRKPYGEPVGSSEELALKLIQAVDALLDAFPKVIEGPPFKESALKEFRKNYMDLRRAQQALKEEKQDWRLWQRLRELRQSKRGSPTPQGYDVLASSVQQAADNLVMHPGPLQDSIAHARALVEGAQLAMKSYELRKRELGVIDFSDMVSSAAKLIAEKPMVLDAIMAEVDCVIVDEFQDTNPIQFSFLWALAKRAKYALIVGDTKQAIMGFQGADPRLTLALTKRFNTSPLTRNWRSDPRIMDFVNAIGPALFGDGYIPLSAQQSKGENTALEIIELGQGRRARSGGKPQHYVADRLLSLLNDDEIKITDRYSGLMRDLEPRDIALLCPSHSLCSEYAKALRALGLPVRVAEGGWWGSLIVQLACFALRYTIDPTDKHAALFLSALGPDRLPLEMGLEGLMAEGKIGAQRLLSLKGLWPLCLAEPLDCLVHKVIGMAGLREFCDRLPDPDQMRADLLRFEHEVAAFIEAHRDMREASGFYGQGAHVFLGWLENRMSLRAEDLRPNPSGANSDSIEIVTWHASKGREWPVVVVCGLDSRFNPRSGVFTTEFENFENLDHVVDNAALSYVPDFAAKETTERFLMDRWPEAQETARRLLYVALTRARERLIIEWPQSDEREELPLPITARRILSDECGFGVDKSEIFVGENRFSARNLICGKDMPSSIDLETQIMIANFDREPRFAINTNDPLSLKAVLSPSQTLEASRPLPDKIETRVIATGLKISGLGSSEASDKGTAVHKAYQILICRPDHKVRVSTHCGIGGDEVDILEDQVSSLRHELSELGYDRLHSEQPIEIILSDGGSQIVIIDLIAEGPDGFMIVDFKSGTFIYELRDYAAYWPQLSAYCDAVETRSGKAVKAAALFWTQTGQLTVGKL